MRTGRGHDEHQPPTRTCSVPPRSSSCPPMRGDLPSREQLADGWRRGGTNQQRSHAHPTQRPQTPPAAAGRPPLPLPPEAEVRAGAIGAAPPERGAMKRGAMRRGCPRRGKRVPPSAGASASRRDPHSLDAFAAETEAALRGVGSAPRSLTEARRSPLMRACCFQLVWRESGAPRSAARRRRFRVLLPCGSSDTAILRDAPGGNWPEKGCSETCASARGSPASFSALWPPSASLQPTGRRCGATSVRLVSARGERFNHRLRPKLFAAE